MLINQAMLARTFITLNLEITHTKQLKCTQTQCLMVCTFTARKTEQEKK